MDPVTTQYGYTYERHTLLEYMDCNNNLDPKAGKPVDRDHLVPNTIIRDLVDDFRKSNLLKNIV